MKKSILLFVSVLVLFNLKAQDPIFLNSNQSLVYLNPSFAGSNGGIRNQFSYRNQWPELSGNITTYLNSSDIYIKPLRAGLALSWMHDDAANGMLKTNVISLSYAQYLSLLEGKLKIIPSVQASYGERTLDLDKFYWGDVYDPRYGFVWTNSTMVPASKKQYFDFSAGLLVNYKSKLFIGASMFHINQPDIGLLGNNKLPYSLNIHTSYNIKFTESTILQLTCLINTQQLYVTNRMAANLISFNHLITGVGYSVHDCGIVNAGYRNNFFSLVLGYDFTISKLAGNTGGSYEVNASFNLRNKELRKTLTSFETW